MRAVAETLKDEAKGISSALKAVKEAAGEQFTDSDHLQLREPRGCG